MNKFFLLMTFLIGSQLGMSQTQIIASQQDTTFIKLSQKGNKIIIKLRNEASNSINWNVTTNSNRILLLKENYQDHASNETVFEYTEKGIPGLTRIVFHQFNSEGKVLNTIEYTINLKVSSKTNVHRIINEYGDIAEVMEAFGINRVGNFGVRKVITRLINVKAASIVHRVRVDKQIKMVQEAIDKKQVN